MSEGTKIIQQLNRQIVDCGLCPRLVAWREEVAIVKKKSFANQNYWGKPVPAFGDSQGDLLIVGLAPAAHGANRTGRMFTGDRSGDFLFAALHRAGLANQANSVSPDDGLMLHRVLITATAHCAPPDNKPLAEEIANCSRYLNAILQLPQWRSVLCLGAISWIEVHRILKEKPPKFGHGSISWIGEKKVLASYHPSQQNTFTGRLTPEMFDQVIQDWSQDSHYG